MAAPQFNIDDIVYLRDSAVIGYIESYRVSGIRQDASLMWVYSIAIPQRPPVNNATYGDRVTLKKSEDFELPESALVTYCEALTLAIATMRANLARLEALQSAQCGGGSA